MNLDLRNTLASIAYLKLDAQGKFRNGIEPSIGDITLAVVQAAAYMDVCGDAGAIAAEVGAISDVSQRHLHHMRRWREKRVVNLEGGEHTRSNGHHTTEAEIHRPGAVT